MLTTINRLAYGTAVLVLSATAAIATPAAAAPAGYVKTDLVSNVPGKAKNTDPNLVNPWGVAFYPGNAFWVSDNGNGLSTLYDGQGNVIPAVFTVPPPTGATGHSAPTGVIINSSFGFLVPGTQLTANFIFSTEDGTISAWAGGLTTNPNEAVLAVNNAPSGAVYKGLEFGVATAGSFIYATNFHAGTIDVFDTNFAPANSQLLGTFADPTVPAGYAPFGIHNIGGDLYVTYAKQNAAQHDDVPGPGYGVVDVFDTDGRLIKRLVTGGELNAPWGVALAPQGFGKFANDILIGNFGNGLINAYDTTGNFIGPVADARGKPIQVEGLWSVVFGGGAASTPDTLYFTAGPQRETNGLFGSISVK